MDKNNVVEKIRKALEKFTKEECEIYLRSLGFEFDGDSNKEEKSTKKIKTTNPVILKILERQEEKEKFIDELSNDSYISWLEEFTKKFSIFSDDDWLYNPNGISKSDLNNVYKLHLLFEIISNYAENKNIEGKPNAFGVNYTIKNNNIIYEIGIMVGQGTVFFCERFKENDCDYIDFNDIKEDIKLKKNKEKVKKLR